MGAHQPQRAFDVAAATLGSGGLDTIAPRIGFA